MYQHRQTTAVVTIDTVYYLAEKDTRDQICKRIFVVPLPESLANGLCTPGPGVDFLWFRSENENEF